MAAAVSATRWQYRRVRSPRAHADRPILITEARQNADDEFDSRRKRYLAMMALRAVCVVAAAGTVQISGWLAAAFMAGALILPWTAVLIANDRPAKRSKQFRRFMPGAAHGQRELTAGDSSSSHSTPSSHGTPNSPGNAGERAASSDDGSAARRDGEIIDV